MTPIIEITNLSKSFGTSAALKNLSIRIEEGELFGFIGPDGAGKTTLFRILTTLLIPDEGDVRVLGKEVVGDFKEIRPQLGYMPGRFSLYQDLSVEENLTFFASVFGTTIEQNYELIKPIYRQLERFKNRLAGQLSGGMKQKLALSCALIHKPKLLILDEPTTGVDAVSRKEFWEMLKILKVEGITIIASTPYMDEALQCDRVALIDKGELLKVGTPTNVTEAFDTPLYGVAHPEKYRLIQTLRRYSNAESVQPFGEFIHYTDIRKEEDIKEDVLRFLTDQGFEQVQIERIQPSIEDLFMRLMQPEEGYE
jgi:ABC-type multidrug transport system ATPase subunit